MRTCMSLNEMVLRATLTGKYRIPRCPRSAVVVKELILHTFLDASQEACGAACYTRHLYENGSICCCLLVASRSYVEPLQAIGKARLKLMAAVLGVKLSQVVGQAPGIKKDDWTFLSDSMDEIYWFRGHRRRFKPFLANLVGEIQTLTNTEQWRHVSTKDDPTDLLTRGLSVSALKEEEG